MMRLFLILLLVPIIEIALFIEVGGLIGTWPTVGIVLLTAVIGATMLRRQGLAVLRSVHGRLAAGENPGRLLADGAMILLAGALLLTPGFFTDAVGLALLVPPVRDWLWEAVAPRLTVMFVDGRAGEPRRGGARRRPMQDQTIEGEYEEVDPSGARAGRPEDRERF
jgi:UPF0716 protein FxsA